MNLSGFLKDIVFPAHCLACGRLGSYICLICQKKLDIAKFDICPYCKNTNIYGLTHPGCRKNKMSLDGLVSIYNYKPPLTPIIKKIKYKLVRDAIDELIRILPAKRLQGINFTVKNNKNIILIPVPVHPKRFVLRGFNHSQAIALSLNKYLKLNLRNDILLRIKNTVPQAGLKNNKERYANMRNAFAVNPDFNNIISGKTVILFDDVWTSGHTIKEATRTLKTAGVKKVYGLTIAR